MYFRKINNWEILKPFKLRASDTLGLYSWFSLSHFLIRNIFILWFPGAETGRAANIRLGPQNLFVSRACYYLFEDLTDYQRLVIKNRLLIIRDQLSRTDNWLYGISYQIPITSTVIRWKWSVIMRGNNNTFLFITLDVTWLGWVTSFNLKLSILLHLANPERSDLVNMFLKGRGCLISKFWYLSSY